MIPNTPYRAFVFDDEPEICSFLEELLKFRGYEVFTFMHPGMCPSYSVKSCVCNLETTCTDIIISDINMPVASGIDFVEEQMGKGCKCRHIALMSGFWDQKNLNRAIQLGCRIIKKPFAINDIVAWLDEVEQNIPKHRVLADWQNNGCFSKE